MRIDYDGKWKELIQREPENFIDFFLSDIYPFIDFLIPPIFIIQDVGKVIGTPKQKGDLVSDIIMKVHLKNGETRYLYIHIEVQSSSEDNFGVKMFNPFYRIRDKYQQDVTALALFVGDTIPKNYDYYEYQFGRTKIRYDFPYYICKNQDEAELKKSKNPLAIAVLACIYLTKTKKNRNFENRLALKKDLIDFIVKQSERHRFSDDTIGSIVSFVLNIMILPKKETNLFRTHLFENVLKQENMSQMTITPIMKDIYDEINRQVFNVSSIEELIEKHKAEIKKHQAAQKALRKKERAAEERARVANEKSRLAEEKAKELARVANEKSRLAEEKAKELAQVANEKSRLAEEKAKELAQVANEKSRLAEERLKTAILNLYTDAKFTISKIAATLSVEEDYVRKVIEASKK